VSQARVIMRALRGHDSLIFKNRVSYI